MTSLVNLCRAVIVANLERYPPSIFGCDLMEWEEIVRLRHRKTRPKKSSSAGLDGTGRMVPAISAKYMASVEEENEELADSSVTDELVWKDCTEYRFRRGGLTRPAVFDLPWSVLVVRIQDACAKLQPIADKEEYAEKEALSAAQYLQGVPMNVLLLQETGAGKTLRKACKMLKSKESTCPLHTCLSDTMSRWKTLASDSGGESKANPQEAALLELQHCHSWRQLFVMLKDKEDTRRTSQGKKMRERRSNLASGRPKVVKVRPTKAKHQRILDRPSEQKVGCPQTPKPNKMMLVRREAAQARANMSPKKKPLSSFGAAVARTNSTQKHGIQHTVHRLGNNRVMSVPKRVNKMKRI